MKTKNKKTFADPLISECEVEYKMAPALKELTVWHELNNQSYST